MLRDTSLCQLVQLDASLVSSRREGVKGSELFLARKGPRKVHDLCKGPQTSPVRLSFDLSLYDEWLEREFLGLTVCVVATSSRQGRQAEIVKASQAFLEGEIGYALDYCIMMSIWGADYWCMSDQSSVMLGELDAWNESSGMIGSGEWNEPIRAGVWDHSLKEQFALLSMKLETATAILDDVKRELAVLQLRCMEEPPAKRAKVTGSAGSGRAGPLLAIGNISTPYPDSPADEVVDAPVRPPMVDLVGEADEDRTGQSEGEDHMPEPGDVDEFLRDHQTFRLKTSCRSRRTYSIGYLDNQTTVGDLHFEFARVSKRGARQFRLVQAGVILDGVLRLGMVDADIDILVEPHSYDDLGQSPLSARRRGGDCRAGAPSSVRSRIARKISKSAQPIPGALDLVQQLWVLESETLRATNGTPDQVRTVIWSLAQKHGARWVGGEWQLDSHQIPTKGAAQSEGQSRQSAGVPVIQIRDSPKKASEFECLKVVSQMVGNDGTPLPVVSRDAYAMGERACVLCDADYPVLPTSPKFRAGSNQL